MGSLIYGKLVILDTDDRTLAHLYAAVLGKLRRDNAFILELVQDDHLVDVWVPIRSALTFRFTGTRLFKLNQFWLLEMAADARLHGALRITPEPPLPTPTPKPIPSGWANWRGPARTGKQPPGSAPPRVRGL